ncbi:hypothetical protein [Aminobacter sp. MET-1]|uniref:hypothetical protein n=1 Tax=Aminobacter sp. MET-1 TaxID=2951085 RepID=UPI002269BAFB|nr:hypothetical protein [Aminobacter sp. MET-1]MCX8570790.1 hypothetical protein [Aminobacter sp. MET-1]
MIVWVWIGSILMVCGVLLLAMAGIHFGRMSGSRLDPLAGRTIEPPGRQGLRVFAIDRTWPGLLLVAVGAMLLLAGAWIG